jgi:8-amino-7-oxononanoate synthase
MASASDSHARALAALARRGRLRRLAPRTGVDVTSNDFLGLAGSPVLAEAARAAIDRGVPIGAGGSRLLRGNHAEHEALEAEAARFFGAETALYFGAGFTANAALLSTLPQRGDLVVHDALVHASAHEGMALSKVERIATPHNDADAIADAIRAWRERGGTGRAWIAVESVYSMDGDLAPLADIMAVADRFDAMVIVDEAHATGVLGPGGRGLAAPYEGRHMLVCLHTCGKALGASGALVTGPATIRDFLINRARGFVYATAPSPVMAAVVRRALTIVRDEPWRRAALAALVAHAGRQLRDRCGIAPSGTHIQPVIVGADAAATALAEHVQAAGYDVRAIRPPTVPEGTARLRISLTLNVDTAVVDGLVAALAVARRTADADADAGGRAGVRVRAAAPGATRGAVAPAASHPTYVVVGTDTDVGKTVVAAGLVAVLGARYWKPVQAGLVAGTDSATVAALARLTPDRIVPEAYRLRTPASPHHAAARDGVTIDVAALAPPPAGDRPLVIETAGGLMVPLSTETLQIDVLARWRLPVVLVASTRLGTINHTLLSIEALRARDIPVHGVVFVGEACPHAEEIVVAHTGVRRLGRLPWLEPLTPETLADAVAAGIDVADLSRPA